ncbi:hypothetical protein [Phytopseudomonas dryadis]|uniref:Uncharacterized protein n=1 Tax=Phytopseudomonas dryadis TaxID=2487520 RepID=A0A4Q9QUM3_9GAMM|nr:MULTISPECIES: hypothetical protein [Pseudomonas]TBU87153.1 hypothetical protein DNK44_20980 [Pseudomonas dryadis]TBV01823.1 hypothetical protein DNK34_20445 [Pseudomonas dryadis]TBV14443.1 hypothetical protein DNK41_20385 [Pseudomonas sp. FRB 230]
MPDSRPEIIRFPTSRASADRCLFQADAELRLEKLQQLLRLLEHQQAPLPSVRSQRAVCGYIRETLDEVVVLYRGSLAMMRRRAREQT